MQERQEHTISNATINRVIIGIILLIILVEVGFFKTYIRHFPLFKDYYVAEGNYTMHFNWIMHFHGVVMMAWVLMLLMQPIFILKGRIKLHRLAGRFSYVLAPLVVLAMYLANRDGYFILLRDLGKPVALQLLAITFPDVVYFIILYSLAIFYKRRPALHMRFMCSTAFLFINPPLDRLLETYLGLPGFSYGIVIVLVVLGTVTLVDSLRTKRISPFVVVFGMLLISKLLFSIRDTSFWQSIAYEITKIF